MWLFSSEAFSAMNSKHLPLGRTTNAKAPNYTGFFPHEEYWSVVFTQYDFSSRSYHYLFFAAQRKSPFLLLKAVMETWSVGSC